MSDYNKYYETENLFGEPYPELINFFGRQACKGQVLDLGCGQGRDAIAIARLGYKVTAIDQAKTGIDQLLTQAKREGLSLDTRVEDIYAFEAFESYDFILLDSMFHFTKPDRERELGLLNRICRGMKKSAQLVICIQDSGDKLQILNQAIEHHAQLTRRENIAFKYVFDSEGHRSESDYRMIVLASTVPGAHTE